VVLDRLAGRPDRVSHAQPVEDCSGAANGVARLLGGGGVAGAHDRATADLNDRRSDGLLHHRQHVTIGGDCTAVLFAEIDNAERELLVQRTTSPSRASSPPSSHRISAACSSASFSTRSARARGRRRYPVHDAGVPTFIDRKPKIAHSKVVVID
jgi:hypothetical protein